MARLLAVVTVLLCVGMGARAEICADLLERGAFAELEAGTEREGEARLAWACVAELAEEVATLRARQVPAGTIAAFDLLEGCPPGWSAFTPAEGRMIVGTGQRVLRESRFELTYGPDGPNYQTGGAETVVLTQRHMPPHGHTVVWRGGGQDHTISLNTTRGDVVNDNQYLLAWQRERGRAGNNMKTTSVGSGAPHPNMPPYIALHFCQKDG